MLDSVLIKWTPALEEHSKKFQFYRRLFLQLRDKRMACFDQDGFLLSREVEIWGSEIISLLLNYNEEREWYDRCAILLDLQKEFLARFEEVEHQD